MMYIFLSNNCIHRYQGWTEYRNGLGFHCYLVTAWWIKVVLTEISSWDQRGGQRGFFSFCFIRLLMINLYTLWNCFIGCTNVLYICPDKGEQIYILQLNSLKRKLSHLVSLNWCKLANYIKQIIPKNN